MNSMIVSTPFFTLLQLQVFQLLMQYQNLNIYYPKSLNSFENNSNLGVKKSSPQFQARGSILRLLARL